MTTFNVLQMRLLGECRGSIDAVKKMGFELKEEEDTVSGLADPSSSESQTSGNSVQQWTLTCFSYVRGGFTVSSRIILPSRSHRALGAPAGSGSQQRDSYKAKPAAVAAAELWPKQHLDLAGADRGSAGAAAQAGTLHRHPGHRAAHQKAQGCCTGKCFVFVHELFCVSTKIACWIFGMAKHLQMRVYRSCRRRMTSASLLSSPSTCAATSLCRQTLQSLESFRPNWKTWTTTGTGWAARWRNGDAHYRKPSCNVR